MGQKVTKNDHIIILNLSQGELYSYCIINIKTQKQSLHLFPHTPPPLPYPPPKKTLAKAPDFQWYLLPGVSMQSCILVVPTKQIHVTHAAFVNCSSLLYCENENFSRTF